MNKRMGILYRSFCPLSRDFTKFSRCIYIKSICIKMHLLCIIFSLGDKIQEIYPFTTLSISSIALATLSSPLTTIANLASIELLRIGATS